MENILSLEYVKKFIEVNSNSDCLLLSTTYKNKKGLLKIKCACGEIFQTNWDNFKHSNKRKCDYCNKEYIINEYGNRTNKYNYCSQFCKGEHQKETLLGDSNPRYLSIECACDFCKKKLFKTPNYLAGRKNVFCSEECYADWQSINKTGENNHNFNPLKTNEEREQGRFFEGYLYWRREVYKRDNYTCHVVEIIREEILMLIILMVITGVKKKEQI